MRRDNIADERRHARDGVHVGSVKQRTCFSAQLQPVECEENSRCSLAPIHKRRQARCFPFEILLRFISYAVGRPYFSARVSSVPFVNFCVCFVRHISQQQIKLGPLFHTWHRG